MNNKHFEGVFCSMCGPVGFYLAHINIHINDQTLAFLISMVTAACAAAVGFFVQLFLRWILNKNSKK